MLSTHKIAKVEQLDDFDDEFVYDIIMKDDSTPYFFANDILVHNSCYFKTHASGIDEAVAVADEVAALTNASFADFMRTSFNCQPGFDDLIRAGREVVAERGLFQAKKKYVLKVADLEGVRVSKLKSQGSEIKKSDTPKVIQAFLKELMNRILSGVEYPEIEAFVNEERRKVLGKDALIFEVGVAKQANNLDALYAEYVRTEKANKGKVTLPGHIRAAINYNELVQEHEQGAKLLKSGDKVKVFYLTPNHLQIKSIAFPAEMDSFPSWFTDSFKVDRRLTEGKMFDQKLRSIFDAIGWEIPTPQVALVNKLLRF